MVFVTIECSRKSTLTDGRILMKNLGIDCSHAIRTPWGDFAWRVGDIPYVLSAISSISGVILGGDVITPQMEYTGDNWFYQPVWPAHTPYNESLRSNVERSVQSASEYIGRYTERNGEGDLFVFVVCSSVEAFLRARR